MKHLSYLIIFTLFLSCQPSSGKKVKIEEKTDPETTEENSVEDGSLITETLIDVENSVSFIDDSIILDGFLGILKIDNYNADSIVIQNIDQTDFTVIKFAAESAEYYEYLNSVAELFYFFAFKPDYNLFSLYSNKTDKFYEIETKEGETKLISIDTEFCSFQTWTEFIMSGKYISIGNDLSENESVFVFYEKPNSQNEGTERDVNEYLLKAIDINGDWIKIRGTSMETTAIENLGWIKWRDPYRLLIKFYLLM